MNEPERLPWTDYRPCDDAESIRRAAAFFARSDRRRSIRRFSSEPVPREAIENCLRAASTAPSGAGLQPWRFVAVADPQIKRRIREASERVEREFYQRKASDEWLGALRPLGVDAEKPMLTEAPWLIALFALLRGEDAEGKPVKHYYPVVSASLAAGLLIAALHDAGLASLVYTPAPTSFLGDLLDRPRHERALMILCVGRPADDATVPPLRRKSLEEIATFL